MNILNKALCLSTLCAVAWFSQGCDSQDTAATSPTPTASPSPSADPLSDSVDAEYLMQDFDDPGERLEIRRQTAQYVSGRFPQWNVKGISTFAYTGNLYLIGVDMTRGEQEQTINLVARPFFPGEGKHYWKVEPLNSEMADALAGWTSQRLKTLKAEVGRLREGER